MARVKRGVTSHARHKKTLGLAKGARGRQSKTIKAAKQRVEKNLQYAYRDRKTRKRDFRALWIQRINAGARMLGLTYGRVIHGLKVAGIDIDRKMLADLAVRDFAAFEAVLAPAKEIIEREEAERVKAVDAAKAAAA